MRLFAIVIFSVVAAAQTPTAGQLLVATAKMKDPDFGKAVVLLFWTDRDAALGLIINRPGTGGPVPLGLNALVREGVGKRVAPFVFLVTDRKQIEALQPGSGVRIYTGTCGWSMEQLTAEIREGLWRLRPATADIVFDARPETLWERLSGQRAPR